MQMKITYTKGNKTKESNYAELYTKHEAKSMNSGAYSNYKDSSMIKVPCSASTQIITYLSYQDQQDNDEVY